MEVTTAKRHSQARDQYLRIHKHLVGPKTADRLFFLAEELRDSQKSEHLLISGWAAAEAALVAQHKTAGERLAMLDVTARTWDSALRITSAKASAKADRPNRSSEFRIAANIVFLPALQQIIARDFDAATRIDCYDSLLALAIENHTELRSAEDRRDKGAYFNHLGLAQELVTMLAGNRILSGRFLLMTSLGRSGFGDYYPRKTHDLQGLYFRRGRVTKIAPLEVKNSSSTRYDAPVISGESHLGTVNSAAFGQLFEAYVRERQGIATASDFELAHSSTESVMHLMRHFFRADELGRHCLALETCHASNLIPSQRSA